jgi:lipopolysaccharide transport system permease protein
MMTTVPEVTYTPDGPARPGGAGALESLLALPVELWRNREMIRRLVRREVQARYRQFFLGSLWVLLQPTLTIAVFLMLNRTGVLNVGDLAVPYPLYALAGLTIWQLFASGVENATRSLASAGSLIVKVNVSKLSLVVASLGTAFVDFSIRALVVAALYAWYGLRPSVTGLLLALAALVPLVALTLALSLIQSLVGILVRDVTGLLPIVLQGLVLLLPIYYQMPRGGVLMQINRWNPLYYLVCEPRDLLLHGTPPSLEGFVASTAFALVLLAVTARLFARGQYKLAERA